MGGILLYNWKWWSQYLFIFITSVLVFFVPKTIIEYIAISELNFTVKDASSALFVSRWIHFVAMFVLFEIVGLYILFSSINLRKELLNGYQFSFVYLSEFVVLLVASLLLLSDIILGQPMAGSNMIGFGYMQQSLSQYEVFYSGADAFTALGIMHVILSTGAVVYTVTTISNFAICGIFSDTSVSTEEDLKKRREYFYRNLYASAALLTVGVLQLAAWIGLPTDNIESKE